MNAKKSKRKNKKRGVSGSKFTRIKNKIRGSRNPYIALQKTKGECPHQLLPELIKWCMSMQKSGATILGMDYPKSPMDLKKNTQVIPFDNINKELRWASERLRLNKHKIEEYLELSESFERSLLVGDYSNTEDILEEIQNKYGYSYWLIENKIAFLQEYKGLEAQKSFSDEIIGEYPNTFTSYITYYVSQRNEDSVTPFRFAGRFQDIIHSSKFSVDVKSYLLFRILEQTDYTENAPLYILTHEESSSIIDLYESYIWLCMKIVGLGPSAAYYNEFCAAIGFISDFSDYRVKKLILLTGEPEYKYAEKLQKRDLYYESCYLMGNVEGSYIAARQAYENNPLEIPALITFSRLVALREASGTINGGLAEKISSKLISIFSLDTDAERSAIDSLKITINYRYLSFSAAIENIAFEVLTESVPLVGGHLTFSIFGSRTLNPCDVVALPIKYREKYLQICEEVYGKQLIIEWQRLVHLGMISEGSVLEDDVIDLGSLINKFIHQKYNEFVELYKDRKYSNDSIYYESLRRIYCYSLVRSERLEAAIDYMVPICLSKEISQLYLPIVELLQGVEWNTLRRYANKLSTSIILYIYSKTATDSSAQTHLRYACEDFLIANEVCRPSELKGIEHTFQLDHLVYYLRYVCVPSVLDISTVYSSSNEVDRERLKICSFLSEIDKKNEEIYRDEIHRLTTKQKIGEGLDYLDRTKLYVNEELLKSWANRELKESFDRYKDYQKAGIGNEESGFSSAFNDYMKEGKPLPNEYLTVPKNESGTLLIDIIDTLKKEFLNNPEFGLDHYLSMRIRHGTLLGVLRGPMEAHQVIFQKDSLAGGYVDGTIIFDDLLNLKEEEKISVHEQVALFSEKYDELLDETIKEYLQIVSDDKPLGIFDITINAIVFYALKEDLVKSESFEEFIDVCLALFWQLLEPSLINAREHFQIYMKKRIESILDSLDSKLSTKLSGREYRVIYGEYRQAWTQVQTAIDQISGWFEKPKESSITSFSLEQVLEIALETIRSMRAGFTPMVERKLDPQLFLQSQDVAIICDILFIIMDNVAKHSGKGESPKVSFDIHYNQAKEIVIHVVNDVDCSANCAANQETLKNIERQIRSGNYRKALTLEGGTGFIKIKKIVDPGNQREDCLRFGFINDDKFEVHAILPTFELMEGT